MLQQELLLAYLAGAMDADGYFTIKKSTYGIRIRKDMHNPTYSEKLGLGQIPNTIPNLLKTTFGGTVYRRKAYTENSRPGWGYVATNKNAARATRLLLPYLRLKQRQAEIILELRASRGPIYRQQSHWFAIEFPEWQSQELLTCSETAIALGYSNASVVSRAIHNGTLLATPYVPSGRKPISRIPRLLVEKLSRNTRHGKYLLPPELIAWRGRLHQEITELNQVGVRGTSTYHKTGCHKPKGVVSE